MIFLAQIIQKGTQLSNCNSREELFETKSKLENFAFLLVPFGALYVVVNSSHCRRGFRQLRHPAPRDRLFDRREIVFFESAARE